MPYRMTLSKLIVLSQELAQIGAKVLALVEEVETQIDTIADQSGTPIEAIYYEQWELEPARPAVTAAAVDKLKKRAATVAVAVGLLGGGSMVATGDDAHAYYPDPYTLDWIENIRK